MRRLTPSVMASLALALCLGGPGLSSASAAVGDQMLANPGLEAPDATGTAPALVDAVRVDHDHAPDHVDVYLVDRCAHRRPFGAGRHQRLRRR